MLGILGKSFFNNQYALQHKLSDVSPLIAKPELVNVRGAVMSASAVIISKASVSESG
jgi:hypothetical protein